MNKKLIAGFLVLLTLGIIIAYHSSLFKSNPPAFALAINSTLNKAYINQDSNIYVQITDRQGQPATNQKVILSTNSQKTKFLQKYYTTDNQGYVIAPLRIKNTGKTTITATLGDLSTSTEIQGMGNKDSYQIFWSTTEGDKTLIPSNQGIPLTFTAFKDNQQINKYKNYLRISSDNGYFLIQDGRDVKKVKKARVNLYKDSSISYVNPSPGTDKIAIKLINDGVLLYKNEEEVNILDNYNIKTIKRLGNVSGENVKLSLQLTDNLGKPVANKNVQLDYFPTASVRPIFLPKVITDEKGQATVNFTSGIIPGKNSVKIAVKDDHGFAIAEKNCQFTTEKGIRSIIPEIAFIEKDKKGNVKATYRPQQQKNSLVAFIDDLFMEKAYAGINFSLGANPYEITAGWQSQTEVTIQVLDDLSQPIPDTLVTWTMPVQSHNWFTSNDTTTDGSGYSTIAINSNKAGTYTLTASVGGSNATATVNVNTGTGLNLKWLDTSTPESNITGTIQLVDWGGNATNDISKLNYIEVDGGQASEQGMYEFSTDQTIWLPQLKITPDQLDANGRMAIYGKRIKDASTISDHFIYVRASINNPPWSPNTDLNTEYKTLPVIP